MTEIAVIMCTYKRPERLRRTLELLNNQTGCGQICLYVWNNEPKHRSSIAKTVDKYRGNVRVKIHNSAKNVGGFGRFYYAKEISDRFPAVIFIDDDIEMADNALATLVSEYKPHSIASFHAFKFISKCNYHRRVAARAGDRADYCGTGGMICDSRIFTEENLFNCPREYWFVEDLWLCYYAAHIMHWSVRASAAKFYCIEDGKNQFNGVADKKSLFLQYLIRQGWGVASRRSTVSKCLDLIYRLSPKAYRLAAVVATKIRNRYEKTCG
ncbi:MAG TPA: glycosyltransferase [Candidatus Saccharimonadales bacterium]|nr:glycosyltransferase [Candidatus Saccharimonadales bacterium]